MTLTIDLRKMPPHVKQNIVYRKIWSNIHYLKKNSILLFCGNVGDGKSSQALRLCSDLDRDFNINRVVNSVDELLELISKGDNGKALKMGSAILFDELAGSEKGADSREALSEVNRTLSYLTTIFRSKRYIVCYCAPLLSQMDKRIRMIGVTGIFESKGIDMRKNKSYAKFNWVVVSGRTGGIYFPKPVYIDKNGLKRKLWDISFDLPESKELIRAYEKKKAIFQKEAFARWHKRLAEKDKSKQMFDFKTLYIKASNNINKLVDKNGNIVTSLLNVHYNLPERKAAYLRAALQSDIDTGRLKVCLL